MLCEFVLGVSVSGLLGIWHGMMSYLNLAALVIFASCFVHSFPDDDNDDDALAFAGS